MLRAVRKEPDSQYAFPAHIPLLTLYDDGARPIGKNNRRLAIVRIEKPGFDFRRYHQTSIELTASNKAIGHRQPIEEARTRGREIEGSAGTPKRLCSAQAVEGSGLSGEVVERTTASMEAGSTPAYAQAALRRVLPSRTAFP